MKKLILSGLLPLLFISSVVFSDEAVTRDQEKITFALTFQKNDQMSLSDWYKILDASYELTQRSVDRSQSVLDNTLSRINFLSERLKGDNFLSSSYDGQLENTDTIKWFIDFEEQDFDDETWQGVAEVGLELIRLLNELKIESQGVISDTIFVLAIFDEALKTIEHQAG